MTGSRRASRHDLVSFVGRKSREQVESDMDKIAAFTSDSVTKAEVKRVGGTLTGSVCREILSDCRKEYSLVILSLKNLRKQVERGSVELIEGSDKEADLDRREFTKVQSFRGPEEAFDMVAL